MRHLAGHVGPVYSVAFSPDGFRLATAGKDGRVLEWYLGGALGPVEWPSDIGPANSVIYATQTKCLAAGWASHVCVRSTGPRLELPAGLPVATIAFCDGGRFLAVGLGNRINAAEPGCLVLFNAARSEAVRRFGSPNGVFAVATTPDGKRILWGGGDKRVTSWEMTAQDTKRSQPGNREVRALALSPDASVFAAADDYLIRIVNATTMQEQRQLLGHTGRVDGLAFTPDGRYLVSGAWDGTVRVWDPESGRIVAAHDWGVGNIRCVAVSPDGLLAAAGCDRGTVIVWDLDF